jgi:pSer/pThr/pTyr-binding forkhead associated (FHA) protein
VGSGYVTGIAPGSAVLVVSRGTGAGSSYLLTGDIVVAGRAPDADLFLDDITVSRRHAEFLRDGESWTIRDTDSLNGTYVNRHRVESTTLQPGDEVQIGKYRFAYLIGGE